MPKELSDEVQCVVIGRTKNFQKNLKEAYHDVRAQTRYLGDFDNPKEMDAYFDRFEIIPGGNGQSSRSVKIEYQISQKVLAKQAKEKEAERAKSKVGGGCGPAGSNYRLV